MTLTISQIKELLQKNPDSAFLAELAADSRSGVQKLLASYRRQQEKNAAEKKRLAAFRDLEREEWKKGFLWVAGCDEAGRGPLAGPLATAAVILPENIWLPGLNDSKKVTARRREELYEEIKAQAVAITLCFLGPREIDELNIYQAAKKSMELCLTHLRTAPQAALTDAMPLRIPGLFVRDLVHGDGRSACIAAASIIAKVSRDRFMLELEQKFPGYGFAHNKGYGAEFHVKALQALGATPWHRHSFEPVKSLDHLPDAVSMQKIIQIK